MKILGIETSCDETAAGVIDFHGPGKGLILSDIVYSQLEQHKAYGGVVPEIAARAHLENIDDVIIRAMKQSGIAFDALDGIAATIGPGLVGGLLVGANAARALALSLNKPFFGINHLEGHALTTRLTHGITKPYLLLLVSGGHTQLLEVKAVGEYQLLGTSIDDAAGEAFDKIAKLLGLGYPGGPIIETLAQQGDAKRFAFPRPMKGREGFDFSFSGLKTAVRQQALKLQPVSEQDKADLAASFQQAVGESLCDRLDKALALWAETHPQQTASLVIAGGVAANQFLRNAFETLCAQHEAELICPPLRLCTDNAVMIAWAAAEKYYQGFKPDLDVVVKPRWPL